MMARCVLVKALDIQRHLDCVGRTAEQAADVRRPRAPTVLAVEHLGQQLIFGNVDRRAASRRHTRVDKVAHLGVVIAKHSDGDLEKFAGVAVIAKQTGDLAGRYASGRP